MKRIGFRLLIATFTLTLGIIVTLALFNFYSPNKENLYEDLPILDYCELANNPEKYDGRIVRVSAKLVGYEDGLAFRDLNCYDDNEKKAAVLEDGRYFARTIHQMMDKLGKERYNPSKEIEIIAVVKFSRIKPTGKTYRFIDNAHLLIEIMEVEKAVVLD